MPIAQEVRWRGGLCVYFKSHANRDDALRELDVSEEELRAVAQRVSAKETPP
jgi:hypothetical protein